MDSDPSVLQHNSPSTGAACAQHIWVGFKSQTCWLMLATPKHHHTTATGRTVAPRNFVKIKVGILNGEKGTELWTQHNPAQKSLHPLWGQPRPSPTQRVWDSGMCFDVLTLQDSLAGSKTTLTCLQTNPERFHFGVTAHSGFHVKFLKLWGLYRICWSWIGASRFPQMRCGSMNKFGPQELFSGNWLLQGSNMSMTVKPKQW